MDRDEWDVVSILNPERSPHRTRTRGIAPPSPRRSPVRTTAASSVVGDGLPACVRIYF
jgi:hypothetical protein